MSTFDKVCIPQYGKCEYNNLEELMLKLLPERGDCVWDSLHLDAVVQYNIRFRDCLRSKGIEDVISMLISECPFLANEEKELNKLRHWWKERMHEKIAAYDIQCYPFDAQLNICGYVFNGLREIESQVEMVGSDQYHWRDDLCFPISNYCHNPQGLHIGKIWDNFPTFDPSDAFDDRSYDNFIIRELPITKEDLRKLCKVSGGINACRTHEHIPRTILPVLYHNDDCDYIILATKKDKSDI